jgi:hypothetical protein
MKGVMEHGIGPWQVKDVSRIGEIPHLDDETFRRGLSIFLAASHECKPCYKGDQESFVRAHKIAAVIIPMVYRMKRIR